uniref:Uncharacterized protein n=1 Tax=Ciona intestinalis TaxID=7719 RepID=H2Y0Q5_CIOIN
MIPMETQHEQLFHSPVSDGDSLFLLPYLSSLLDNGREWSTVCKEILEKERKGRTNSFDTGQYLLHSSLSSADRST